MILLREVRESDLGELQKFADIPGFINLPSDPKLLEQRIKTSRRSFLGEIQNPSERKFIFVAEDQKKAKIAGTAMIAGQHGTEQAPHFYFKLGREEHFSKTLNAGFIHTTLQLQYEKEGPTELGALILDPDYRGRPEKIGKQISFVRFLFLGMHPHLFKDHLIAELLPPFNQYGQSPLWEAIGRRFTNLDYAVADRLSKQDKEFIFSLFPQEKIYTTFLPSEARSAIGRVGAQTQPVYSMLKKVGFRYQGEIDPFDGGPHLRARVDEVEPVQNIAEKRYAGPLSQLAGSERTDEVGQNPTIENKRPQASASPARPGLLGCEVQRKHEFSSMMIHAYLAGSDQLFVQDNEEAKALKEVFHLKQGDRVFFMPFHSD